MTTVRFNNGRYEVWDEITESFWEVSKATAVHIIDGADKLVLNEWQQKTLETIKHFNVVADNLLQPYIRISAGRQVGKSTLIRELAETKDLVIGLAHVNDVKCSNYIQASYLNEVHLSKFKGTSIGTVWLDDVDITQSMYVLIIKVLAPKKIITIYTPAKEA